MTTSAALRDKRRRGTARTMSQENVDLVRRSIAAYNERDFDAIEPLTHPDVELDWSASRGLEARIYKGWEEVLRFYQNFLDTFEEVKIEADRFIESGNSVIVPNTSQNRGRDGILTTASSAFVFTVRDGLIARIRLHQELPEALEAAGLAE
jgi:ketosteroid isomerase-like protein